MRIYIDTVNAWWTGVLLFVFAAAVQVAILAARKRSSLLRTPSRGTWKLWFARWSFACLALTLLPAIWIAAFHGEIHRRIHTFEERGGRVRFEAAAVLADFTHSLMGGDFSVKYLLALLNPFDPTFKSERHELIGELVRGLPVAEVVLRDATLRDLQTLRAFRNVRTLTISGEAIDDAAMTSVTCPQLEALRIQSAHVTGSFLADPDLFPKLRAVSFEASPFGDTELSYLVKRRVSGVNLFNTQVTPNGLMQLKDLPAWPALSCDVQFSTEDVSLLIDLLESQDQGACTWVIIKVGEIGPSVRAAAPALASLLDGDMGDYALWALLRIGGESRQLVVDTFADWDLGIGSDVARMYRELEFDHIAPNLITLLESKDEPSREKAVGVLAQTLWLQGTVGRAAAAQVLKWGLHEDVELRREYVATILGGLGPRASDAVPALVNSLDGANERSRRATLNVLNKIAPNNGYELSDPTEC